MALARARAPAPRRRAPARFHTDAYRHGDGTDSEKHCTVAREPRSSERTYEPSALRITTNRGEPPPGASSCEHTHASAAPVSVGAAVAPTRALQQCAGVSVPSELRCGKAFRLYSLSGCLRPPLPSNPPPPPLALPSLSTRREISYTRLRRR